MNQPYLDAIARRRSQYALGKELPLPQQEVTRLIQEAVRLSPSAFNSQSSRAVILYGTHSDRFWEIVKDALRGILPENAFAAAAEKLDGFAAGAGTILFYEDQEVVADLQRKYAIYADNFPIWSEQASGMAQFAVWSALADANIGASLQHYNPLPDAQAAAEWGIPTHWKLRAQMPFGANKGDFGDKVFMDDEARFRVFG